MAVKRAKIKDMDKPKRTRSQIGKTSKSKGSQFERDVCKQLSKWWTGGKRDDIFYRTGGSGGMATNRARKGAQTANSAGDIGYLDSDGEDLLKLFTFELKKGYPDVTLQRLIDTNPQKPSSSNFLGWVNQAIESAAQSGSDSWMIIHSPPRRKVLVYMQGSVLVQLTGGETIEGPYILIKNSGTECLDPIVVITFEQFLNIVTRTNVEEFVS